MAIQWQRQTRLFILVLLLILSIIFAFLFKDFIKYLSISALMAFILIPLKDFLQKRFHLWCFSCVHHHHPSSQLIQFNR